MDQLKFLISNMWQLSFMCLLWTSAVLLNASTVFMSGSREKRKPEGVLCAKWEGHLGCSLSLRNVSFLLVCVAIRPLCLQVSMAACFIQPWYNLKAILLQQYEQGPPSLSWAIFFYSPFKVSFLLVSSVKPEMRHPCSCAWNISQFSCCCLNLI